jgi:hypothetical protein
MRNYKTIDWLIINTIVIIKIVNANRVDKQMSSNLPHSWHLQKPTGSNMQARTWKRA